MSHATKFWASLGEEMGKVFLVFTGFGCVICALVGFVMICIHMSTMALWLIGLTFAFWIPYGLIAGILHLWDKSGKAESKKVLDISEDV